MIIAGGYAIGSFAWFLGIVGLVAIFALKAWIEKPTTYKPKAPSRQVLPRIPKQEPKEPYSKYRLRVLAALKQGDMK